MNKEGSLSESSKNLPKLQRWRADESGCSGKLALFSHASGAIFALKTCAADLSSHSAWVVWSSGESSQYQSVLHSFTVLPFEAFDQRASNIILKHFRLRGVCRTRDFWCFFFERWGRWGRWGCPHLCANWLVTDIENCLAMAQELL
jgi:hypothetical protein